MAVTMSEVPHPARFEKKKNKPVSPFLPGANAWRRKVSRAA
jgi:hypothetical protein